MFGQPGGSLDVSTAVAVPVTGAEGSAGMVLFVSGWLHSVLAWPRRGDCAGHPSTFWVTTGRGEPGTLRQPWHGLLTTRRASARR